MRARILGEIVVRIPCQYVRGGNRRHKVWMEGSPKKPTAKAAPKMAVARPRKMNVAKTKIENPLSTHHAA